METGQIIIGPDDPVLVTGAAGFIGSRVVASLIDRGLRNIRCMVRPSSDLGRLEAVTRAKPESASLKVIRGNLLSREDCERSASEVAVIYHLAAGTGTKSFADAFLNSVVTTRNLCEAALKNSCLKRLVSISSFAVYTNDRKPRRGVLDESCPVETSPELRGEAYCYGKVKQDELVMEYGHKRGLPYVLIRPGVVYGPGKFSITARVGTGTFGLFLHLGGGNPIPFTYVENCADAVALAGLQPGINGESFNIVDDDLPSSRQFLRQYKKHVKPFRSVYIPHGVSYGLCWLWEKYAAWSQGQLPPVYNRREWLAYWKRTRYSNAKAKRLLGWSPRVATGDGLRRYFESCRTREQHA
jgi:2-alkyl-3-oxoalkanoate reductase